MGTSDDFRVRLGELSPDVPWTHYFEIDGIPTIARETNEKFFKKAKGLKELGEICVSVAEHFSAGNTINGKRILDIACGEGGHSVQFAQAGAKQVLGVEGRELYVNRANMIADALGLGNMSVELGDVRAIDSEKTGQFDITICFGILHHLGLEDFEAFVQSLSDLTSDTLLLYTHVSSEKIADDFKLKGPVKTESGYKGYLFREHQDGASEDEKIAQVRASLDNTFSFWATNENLIKALKKSGFDFILKVYEPHMFGSFENKNFRQIIVARKCAT